MVLNVLSPEVAIGRPIEPSDFLLNTIDVLELFQVFIAEVIIFHMVPNLLPDLLFDFRVLGEEVDGHGQIVGSGFDSGHKEGVELVEDAFFIIDFL